MLRLTVPEDEKAFAAVSWNTLEEWRSRIEKTQECCKHSTQGDSDESLEDQET